MFSGTRGLGSGRHAGSICHVDSVNAPTVYLLNAGEMSLRHGALAGNGLCNLPRCCNGVAQHGGKPAAGPVAAGQPGSRSSSHGHRQLPATWARSMCLPNATGNVNAPELNGHAGAKPVRLSGQVKVLFSNKLTRDELLVALLSIIILSPR